MNIPIIINNRDLLTWPKKMVEKIKTYDDVGEIIIYDNNSTYKPLLEWYETNPCTIIRGDNLGHTAPWDSGLVKSLNSEFYVITDPDLGLDNTPKNTLKYLFDNVIKYNLPKLGLGLEWEPTPIESPYFEHIFNYEKKRFKNSRIDNNIHLDVSIDTTFAIYNKNYNYFIGGACTGEEYRAKHYPWYMTVNERNNNSEFMYYLNNASNSCSYKTFLRL